MRRSTIPRRPRSMADRLTRAVLLAATLFLTPRAAKLGTVIARERLGFQGWV